MKVSVCLCAVIAGLSFSAQAQSGGSKKDVTELKKDVVLEKNETKLPDRVKSPIEGVDSPVDVEKVDDKKVKKTLNLEREFDICYANCLG